MNDFSPTWFNFGSLGHPEWSPICKLEMGLMLAGAELIVDSNPRAVCDTILDIKCERLLRSAILGQVNDDWLSEALLVTAMRGLMGYQIPLVKNYQD